MNLILCLLGLLVLSQCLYSHKPPESEIPRNCESKEEYDEEVERGTSEDYDKDWDYDVGGHSSMDK